MLPITPDSHVAEGVGFEPTEGCPSPPFQGGTFAHSVIPLQSPLRLASVKRTDKPLRFSALGSFTPLRIHPGLPRLSRDPTMFQPQQHIPFARYKRTGENHPGVLERIRTLIPQNHNLMLYQLSYQHILLTSYPAKLVGLALLTRRLSLLPYWFTATQYNHSYFERNRDEVVYGPDYWNRTSDLMLYLTMLTVSLEPPPQNNLLRS